MEDILRKIQLEVDANNFIRSLEQGKEVVFPTDQKSRDIYRNIIQKFIDHNEEKYRDPEGLAFLSLLKGYLAD